MLSQIPQPTLQTFNGENFHSDIGKGVDPVVQERILLVIHCAGHHESTFLQAFEHSPKPRRALGHKAVVEFHQKLIHWEPPAFDPHL
mmetsp:Transcript_18192/g.51327  ORF Transcript_18192/g.51327 Transcript_18192/m.51327 type:complete len:87 (+) Transcript_18192:319-579(+)